MKKIAIIGKGRVATHLGKALSGGGHFVVMCGGRERICDVPDDADMVVLAVKDDCIGDVSLGLEGVIHAETLVVHTAGSVGMGALVQERRGVFYPMQTFSMEREVDFSKVPLFLEASDDEGLALLDSVARSISRKVYHLDGEKRGVLHLAAVFCCNFVNHMYALSEELLEREGIPFETMLALIDETAAKVHELSPRVAQTGPAVRWDESVMERHIGMLSDERVQMIYKILSRNIHDKL